MGDLSKTKISVLNSFERRTDDWHYSEFERALEQAMGARYGNYQTAKMTILSAYKNGGWPKTVEQYVRSNFSGFGNLPTELINIGQHFGLYKKEQP